MAQSYGQAGDAGSRSYVYDYDYYAPNSQPSPSDLPPETAADDVLVTDDAYQVGGGCDAYCSSECCDEPWRLFPESPCGCGWSLTGWVAGGAAPNADNPVSRYNGPVTFADREEVQLNQLYAVLERPIDTSCSCWDIGGRIDVLFGTDYIFTQAVGLETHIDGSPKWNNRRFYGLALPQAYAEIGYDEISVKLGHFYTPIGYESVMAPSNFFYTHPYAHQYGEPFTHTGLLASMPYNERTTIWGGFHNGWDIFDRFSERIGVLGGFTWTSYDELLTLSLGVTSGDEFNGSGVYTNRTMYSVVATLQLTERLEYVLQHDNGWQKDFFADEEDAEWYGVNQYLFYTINDCWKLGGRFEWFRDDDGVRVTGVRADNPITGDSFVGDFYQATLGLNWIPTNNLRVRPEVRWDWFDGAGLPYNDGTEDDQFIGAVDMILLW
jgi:hypothetical protein